MTAPGGGSLRWPEDEPVFERKPYVEKSVDRFAVALAFLPLSTIVFLLLGLGNNLVLDLLMWGVMIALGFLDARELRRLGHRVHGWWGILLPLVHLIHRTIRSGRSKLIPWLWVVSVIASIWAGLALAPEDGESWGLGDSAPVVAAALPSSH